jgi:UDP-glucose 4-epimerase
MTITPNDIFSGKRVLITGGLGFIGSNLAIRLIKYGAKVTIVDSMIPEYGGNLFNIKPIKNEVKINYCDITDKNAIDWVVQNQDYIFHLAGQVSHILSFENPYKDVDYNITGTLILLEACRNYNQTAKIIYTGTRGQYGKAVKLPVDELAPTNPTGVYELTNLTAEKLFSIYHNHYGIKSILTRITNVYGPRAQMKSNKYGVANWLIRLCLDNQPITVYGDGSIKRDFVYIDDVIDALCQLPANRNCYGEIFNIGHTEISDFNDLSKLIVSVSGKGKIVYTDFSPERAAQEPGDFYSDLNKIKQYIGWKPKIQLAEGLSKTINYYEKYKQHYW